MDTQPYRESAASEVATSVVARPSPPVRPWVGWLQGGLLLASLLFLLVDAILWSPWRLLEFAVLGGCVAATWSDQADGVDKLSGLTGSALNRWRDIRYRQQCEREALKARRAQWKAEKLAEREAARAWAEDKAPGE